MMTQLRYVFVALAVLISLHYLLSFTNESYGNATSFDNLKEQFTDNNPPDKNVIPPTYDNVDVPPIEDDYYSGHTSATGNTSPGKDGDAAGSTTVPEDYYGGEECYKFFSPKGKCRLCDARSKCRITTLTDSPVHFGQIPRADWFQPDWCVCSRQGHLPLEQVCRMFFDVCHTKSRPEMQQNGVIYGGSLPYRNMCRFNSGFFYRHELLKPFKYYWRIEPDVKFFCDLDFDPFLVMQDQNKVYGFTVALPEYETTIPTLWKEVRKFINANPGLVSPDNAMDFLSDDGGETYNRCHFWSNFEIADLDLWRGEAYSKFFDFLDEQGGFYYERWGDAPVHSIGAALFARKDQIHFFNEIGYRHEPFQHCPQGDAHRRGKCWCDPQQNFDYEWYSCLKKYDALFEKS
ncbi:Glycosyl transferase [Mycena sanguinolenta]|uniref:Glycosyl transferase n=1 Tax=Mycena sanguinolenta TaxID=230812 RepID=A0A8H7D6R8_9AGAR|nr:Glycosyl transferase [Mycena sanguinolenta]